MPDDFSPAGAARQTLRELRLTEGGRSQFSPPLVGARVGGDAALV